MMAVETELTEMLSGRVGYLRQQGRAYACVIREGLEFVYVGYFRTKDLALAHCERHGCTGVFLSLNPKAVH